MSKASKEAQKRWKERNRESVRAQGREYQKRTRRLMWGLSYEEFKALSAQQNNCCAICGQPEPRTGFELAIDHCHKTNKRRKLLCSVCNSGLGFFKDNPILLRKAADYLEEFNHG